MNVLDSLQNMLGQGSRGLGQGSGAFGGEQGSAAGGSSLQGVLGQLFSNPNTGAGIPLLGGLIGAVVGKNSLRGAAGGALLMKGIQMYSQYKDRMRQEASNNPNTPAARNYLDVTAAPSNPDERARRIIRALVYAAKSDGNVDETEQQAIMERTRDLNLGEAGNRLVQDAMRETVDPKAIADGVKTPEEALEVFTVSCAVLHSAGFMVNAYLKELAKQLAIPDDVRDDLVSKIGDAAQA